MNLQTRYLGLRLRSPLIAAASPLSREIDGLRKLEDAGASAIVLFSIFSEQITGKPQVPAFNQFGNDVIEEAHSFAPDPTDYHATPEEYLNLIAKAKATTDTPIIASVNTCQLGEWVHYVRNIEQAGADALELNIFRVAADPVYSGDLIERQYLDIVRAVKKETSLPVAVKILPYFTSLGNFARSLCVAGADAIVLFNWLYQPDIDLANLESTPHRDPGAHNDCRLPLHWTSCLYGRIQTDLAVTGGLRNHVDVLKAIASGGAVAQLATELLRRGPNRLTEIETAMTGWMERNGYSSLSQLRGSMSKLRIADPAGYARLHYIKELQSIRPHATLKPATH